MLGNNSKSTRFEADSAGLFLLLRPAGVGSSRPVLELVGIDVNRDPPNSRPPPEGGVMIARRKKNRPNATGRNQERFILLPHWMLDSPAWLALSPPAMKLLIAVWRRHNGENNGEVSYSVREAERIGISKDQASRAFAELVKLGFLICHRQSTFTMKQKEARTWEITAERCGENPATKGFMRPKNPEHGSASATHSSASATVTPETPCKHPPTVAPVRPSLPISASPRSHRCDTSIYHGGSSSDRLSPCGAGDDPTTDIAHHHHHRLRGTQPDPAASPELLLVAPPAASSAPKLRRTAA
ncbi:MAG: helix-turn-helix domain-containing protein [Alphaproteobacteria bacterium]|nr:helix-turn-helix domain-containing protein [Alphaproteobacteria bacterium]